MINDEKTENDLTESEANQIVNVQNKKVPLEDLDDGTDDNPGKKFQTHGYFDE